MWAWVSQARAGNGVFGGRGSRSGGAQSGAVSGIACSIWAMSVEARAGGLHHGRPLGDFRFDIGIELLRRIADDVDAEVAELPAHEGIVQCLDGSVMQRADDLARRAGRRDETVPGGGVE